MEVKFTKEVDEITQDDVQDLPFSPSDNSRQGQSQTTKLERNQFRLNVFCEYFSYFLLYSFLGPLSYYLFFRWFPNGSIFARNLHVHGDGKYEIFRGIIWVVKVFCYITTFALDSINPHEQGSISQFWILVYTDASLAVLYGGYYSSFTKREIQRLWTEFYDPGSEIFDRLMNLVKQDKTRFLDTTTLNAAFPEIDSKSFYFVFPKSQEEIIPTSLEPAPLKSTAPHLLTFGIVDGVVVRGEKLTTHIIEIAGYQHFDAKIILIKIISRLFVFIRIILPVIANVYRIIENDKSEHTVHFVIYVIQQVFYSALIYRFVTVYDVLFLGLILYTKKYNLLKQLGKVLLFKPKSGKKEHRKLRISGSIPQNAHTWLSVRKILSSVNRQAFVVVDTNMSFVLFYTFVFVALYILQQLEQFSEVLGPAAQFLASNPGFMIVLALTVLVVAMVLVVNVAIGILINDLFINEKGFWTQHDQITGSIATKIEMYLEHEEELWKFNMHSKRLTELKELLGENYKKELPEYLKRLRKSISLTIDRITAEEKNNPHKLLGIPTDIPLIVTVGTITSALGVTTLSNVITLIRDKVTM